jgi:hypothetical protein
MQHPLRCTLYALGHLVQHVDALVHPAALLPTSWIDFSERCPESQRPVSDCQLWSPRWELCADTAGRIWLLNRCWRAAVRGCSSLTTTEASPPSSSTRRPSRGALAANSLQLVPSCFPPAEGWHFSRGLCTTYSGTDLSSSGEPSAGVDISHKKALPLLSASRYMQSPVWSAEYSLGQLYQHHRHTKLTDHLQLLDRYRHWKQLQAPDRDLYDALRRERHVQYHDSTGCGFRNPFDIYWR